MSEQQPVKLFREKSIEAVESPESLNDYLRVTSPGIWLVMTAVIALLLGGIVWGIWGHIRTTERFAVAVGPDSSVCYVSYNVIDEVLTGGVIRIDGVDYPLNTNGDITVELVSEKTPPRVLLTGKLSIGDQVVKVPVITDLEEGYYSGEAVIEDLQPISLLLQ